jgi:hypothetical protein
MKKNTKKILLLVFVLVLIFLAYFLVNISLKEKMTNSPALNKPVEQNSVGDIDSQEAAQPAEEFVPEMMTSEEKAEMKLGAQLNLQVISRDADGKVEAYKIIRSESDIINLNQ